MNLIIFIGCVVLVLFAAFVIRVITEAMSEWIRNIQYNKLRRQCKEQQEKEREQDAR